jgi:hypothetical protein
MPNRRFVVKRHLAAKRRSSARVIRLFGAGLMLQPRRPCISLTARQPQAPGIGSTLLPSGGVAVPCAVHQSNLFLEVSEVSVGSVRL